MSDVKELVLHILCDRFGLSDLPWHGTTEQVNNYFQNKQLSISCKSLSAESVFSNEVTCQNDVKYEVYQFCPDNYDIGTNLFENESQPVNWWSGAVAPSDLDLNQDACVNALNFVEKFKLSNNSNDSPFTLLDCKRMGDLLLVLIRKTGNEEVLDQSFTTPNVTDLGAHVVGFDEVVSKPIQSDDVFIQRVGDNKDHLVVDNSTTAKNSDGSQHFVLSEPLVASSDEASDEAKVKEWNQFRAMNTKFADSEQKVNGALVGEVKMSVNVDEACSLAFSGGETVNSSNALLSALLNTQQVSIDSVHPSSFQDLTSHRDTGVSVRIEEGKTTCNEVVSSNNVSNNDLYYKLNANSDTVLLNSETNRILSGKTVYLDDGMNEQVGDLVAEINSKSPAQPFIVNLPSGTASSDYVAPVFQSLDGTQLLELQGNLSNNLPLSDYSVLENRFKVSHVKVDPVLTIKPKVSDDIQGMINSSNIYMVPKNDLVSTSETDLTQSLELSHVSNLGPTTFRITPGETMDQLCCEGAQSTLVPGYNPGLKPEVLSSLTDVQKKAIFNSNRSYNISCERNINNVNHDPVNGVSYIDVNSTNNNLKPSITNPFSLTKDLQADNSPVENKFYPPSNIDKTKTFYVKTKNDWNTFGFTRSFITSQQYGNGQYDMAISSAWSGEPKRSSWSIFTPNDEGWLSGGGFDGTTGLANGGTTTKVGNDNVVGQWAQVTFPEAMNFNGFMFRQNAWNYGRIKTFLIVANNNTSVANAPYASNNSLYTSINTPSNTILSAQQIDQTQFLNQTWNLVYSSSNINLNSGSETNVSFTNDTDYRTYRIIVTSIVTGSGTPTSCSLDFCRFIRNSVPVAPVVDIPHLRIKMSSVLDVAPNLKRDILSIPYSVTNVISYLETKYHQNDSLAYPNNIPDMKSGWIFDNGSSAFQQKRIVRVIHRSLDKLNVVNIDNGTSGLGVGRITKCELSGPTYGSNIPSSVRIVGGIEVDSDLSSKVIKVYIESNGSSAHPSVWLLVQMNGNDLSKFYHEQSQGSEYYLWEGLSETNTNYGRIRVPLHLNGYRAYLWIEVNETSGFDQCTVSFNASNLNNQLVIKQYTPKSQMFDVGNLFQSYYEILGNNSPSENNLDLQRNLDNALSTLEMVSSGNSSCALRLFTNFNLSDANFKSKYLSQATLGSEGTICIGVNADIARELYDGDEACALYQSVDTIRVQMCQLTVNETLKTTSTEAQLELTESNFQTAMNYSISSLQIPGSNSGLSICSISLVHPFDPRENKMNINIPFAQLPPSGEANQISVDLFSKDVVKVVCKENNIVLSSRVFNWDRKNEFLKVTNIDDLVLRTNGSIGTELPVLPSKSNVLTVYPVNYEVRYPNGGSPIVLTASPNPTTGEVYDYFPSSLSSPVFGDLFLLAKRGYGLNASTFLLETKMKSDQIKVELLDSDNVVVYTFTEPAVGYEYPARSTLNAATNKIINLKNKSGNLTGGSLKVCFKHLNTQMQPVYFRYATNSLSVKYNNVDVSSQNYLNSSLKITFPAVSKNGAGSLLFDHILTKTPYTSDKKYSISISTDKLMASGAKRSGDVSSTFENYNPSDWLIQMHNNNKKSYNLQSASFNNTGNVGNVKIVLPKLSLKLNENANRMTNGHEQLPSLTQLTHPASGLPIYDYSSDNCILPLLYNCRLKLNINPLDLVANQKLVVGFAVDKVNFIHKDSNQGMLGATVSSVNVQKSISCHQLYNALVNGSLSYVRLPKNNLVFTFSSFAGVHSNNGHKLTFHIDGGNYNVHLYEKQENQYVRVGRREGILFEKTNSPLESMVISVDDDDDHATSNKNTGLTLEISRQYLLNIKEMDNNQGYVMKVKARAPLKVLDNSIEGVPNSNPCFVASPQLIYSNALKIYSSDNDPDSSYNPDAYVLQVREGMLPENF